MEKLSMQALGRLSVDDFRLTNKLPVTLVLDNVRSGLNVGSIFRTADAFALQQLVLCGITAQPPHREILKTALGSSESVEWIYFPDVVDAVKALKTDGWRLLAVEQTTEKIWLQELAVEAGKRYAFVLGNEVNGVSAEVLPFCEASVEIPQFGTKHSLNVAVAAGIVAWEAARKLALPI